MLNQIVWTTLLGASIIFSTFKSTEPYSTRVSIQGKRTTAQRAAPPQLQFDVMVVQIKDLRLLKQGIDSVDSLVFHLQNPRKGKRRRLYVLVAYKAVHNKFELIPDLITPTGAAVGMGKDKDVNLANYNFNFDPKDFPSDAVELRLVPVLGSNVTGYNRDTTFNNYVRYRKDFYDQEGKLIDYEKYYKHGGSQMIRQRFQPRPFSSGTGLYLNPSPPA